MMENSGHAASEVGARRYPGADALRGLAILLVVGNHYQLLPYVGGVDLFFVISGFLLGGILVEKRGTGNYYRTFWARRACRLFPLYFAFLGMFFGAKALVDVGWVAMPDGIETWLYDGLFAPWVYAVFGQNLASAYEGVMPTGALLQTWSLAVEEHLVLVLAPLVALCPPRGLRWVAFGAVLGAPLFRYWCYVEGWSVASSVLLPAKADSFALGLLVALAARSGGAIPRAGLALLALAAPPFALYALFPGSVPQSAWVGALGDTALSGFWAAALLASLSLPKGTLPLLKPLVGCGTVAYGAFLFHSPLMALINWTQYSEPFMSLWYPLAGERWKEELTVVVSLVATFALAWLSWRLFERPIVRWGRKRFRYGSKKREDPEARQPQAANTSR